MYIRSSPCLLRDQDNLSSNSENDVRWIAVKSCGPRQQLTAALATESPGMNMHPCSGVESTQTNLSVWETRLERQIVKLPSQSKTRSLSSEIKGSKAHCYQEIYSAGVFITCVVPEDSIGAYYKYKHVTSGVDFTFPGNKKNKNNNTGVYILQESHKGGGGGRMKIMP